LQAEAWMQTPPWQFVEQHSLPAAQAFPSVVQLAIVVLTTSQVPLVPHLPEQHWPFWLHATPVLSQAAATQLPARHESEQHSVDEVQLAPDWVQNADVVHFPEAQTVEQHCVSAVHVSPPTPHATTGGAAHFSVAPSHFPEQHWPGFAAVQVDPWGRHWLGGSVHRPFTQEFVQQFASEPQVSLTALHVDGCTQLPVHAWLQHSPGPPHEAPRALHVAAGPQMPPLHWLEQHSDAPPQTAPSLLQVDGASQKPLGHELEQHSEAARHVAPLPLQVADEREREQPEAATAMTPIASATSTRRRAEPIVPVSLRHPATPPQCAGTRSPRAAHARRRCANG
jgi:hypothetical protein